MAPRAPERSDTAPAAFDDVRRIGLTLPGAETGTMYGAPALKLKGQMFVCLASHSSAEPNSLVVRMSFESRDALLAEDPATYYITDHYAGYPSVLVRLDRVHPDALADLVRAGWRYVSERVITTPRPHASLTGGA
jgi:hypothetical protein